MGMQLDKARSKYMASVVSRAASMSTKYAQLRAARRLYLPTMIYFMPADTCMYAAAACRRCRFWARFHDD